ncbi:MAG TPA: LamG domain-containing protein [Candidatus Saccharimonadales bacterium]|nr:LamG domain-containing protein [Candidatus Saccharimonadales bacterium]
MAAWSITSKTRRGKLAQILIGAVVAISPFFVLVSPAHATSGLLASYSFDRDSGPYTNQVFFDESGNGNDCIGSDQHITLQAGHTNTAINDASSSQYATCTNHNLQPTTGITVMAWILNTSGGGYQSSLVNMPSSATTDAWGLYGGTWAQGFSGGITTTGGSAWLPSSVPQNDGQWHHLALTYDGATAKFYVDGTLTNSQALTGTITYSSTLPLQLYEDNTGMSNFQADIDDLRIYDTALSKPEVRTLMNTPVSSSASHSYSRSITMSDSTPSASNVTYSTTITADETYDIQTIVVDFCSDSPVVGETCTAPAGFSLGTPAVSNFQIGGTPVTGWTASSPNSTTLVYGGSSGTTVNSGGQITFDITGITNPSATGSFYARILTYSFASPSYTDTSPDNFKESGGLALSTGQNGTNITFEVPESLTFCVYQATCGDDPSFTIGHTVGTTKVIDSTAVDTATVNFSLSTNAQTQVAIRMKGNTLTNTAGSIHPAGATAIPFAAGTEDFGLRVSTAGASLTASAPYNGAANNYAFDTTTGGENVTTTYGDQLATVTGPVDTSVSTLTFAATTQATTPAGTYNAPIALVATATF